VCTKLLSQSSSTFQLLGGIRMILQCFWELTTQQNVGLSSRLLADLIVPLVDIVHTYNQDDSFVGLYLIDLSLSCLVAIQNNNLKVSKFSIYFKTILIQNFC
jgi:hypothetical protein